MSRRGHHSGERESDRREATDVELGTGFVRATGFILIGGLAASILLQFSAQDIHTLLSDGRLLEIEDPRAPFTARQIFAAVGPSIVWYLSAAVGLTGLRVYLRRSGARRGGAAISIAAAISAAYALYFAAAGLLLDASSAAPRFDFQAKSAIFNLHGFAAPGSAIFYTGHVMEIVVLAAFLAVALRLRSVFKLVGNTALTVFVFISLGVLPLQIASAVVFPALGPVPIELLLVLGFVWVILGIAFLGAKVALCLALVAGARRLSAPRDPARHGS